MTHITKDGRFIRTDIWREGDWVDLWSVVHFLSGISLALAMYRFGFETLPAFIIATLLLIAYELWEAMVKIEETRANRVMDVVVGLASFAPVYSVFAPMLDRPQLYASFAAVFTVNVVMSYFGWSASRKAEVFEERMREEYRRERERVQIRLKLLRERRSKKRAQSTHERSGTIHR